jgi:hypothetical protein
MSLAADPTSFGIDYNAPEVYYHCENAGTPDATFQKTEQDCSLKAPVPDEGSGDLICWEDELAGVVEARCPAGYGNAKGLDDALEGLTHTYMNPEVDTTLNVANFERCYCNLIYKASTEGFDAAYTAAIWVEESGASNYELDDGVQDLGINGANVPAANLEAQFESFRGLESFYGDNDLFSTCRNNGPNTGVLSVFKFLQIFAAGGTGSDCDRENTGWDWWINQVQEFYGALHMSSAQMNLDKVLPSPWNFTFD